MEDERAERPIRAATEVPLPPERAFVVQLRPLTDPAGELFVGRIEHVASGAVFRFRSAAELTGFIEQICEPRRRRRAAEEEFR
jgi:hypothetical protein